MKKLQENNRIPKIIWMYWQQGWENAPELVKQCRKSWEIHNSDYDIRCLDKNTVLDYFDIEAWMPSEKLKPKWLMPFKKWLHKSPIFIKSILFKLYKKI